MHEAKIVVIAGNRGFHKDNAICHEKLTIAFDPTSYK